MTSTPTAPASRQAVTGLLARTHVLLNTLGAEWLSAGKAAQLAGTTTTDLRARSEAGDILAMDDIRRPSVRVYFRDALLARMADDQVPASAFDAARYAAPWGVRLPPHEFAVEEAERREQGPQRVWRVEARTRISDPQDPVLRQWRGGDRSRAESAMASEHPQLVAQHQADLDRGVRVQILWAAPARLTGHTMFLAHSFRLASRAGYPVRVLTGERLAALQHAARLPSLMVYPGVVYVLCDTDQGRPDGAIRIDDPGLAEDLDQLLTPLHNQRVPISTFVRDHL
ncbi:DUF6879 family protein [Nocardiopsis flavescens]|uniref:DUF6879 family protein n=1 Tax=Nocardiopsis flavescens TaxID=758803 RepID=UPI00365AD38F